MIYDAVIIGAGPAGAFCALKLVQKGAKVLLLDKTKFPRDKVCGGLISQKAISLIGEDIIKHYEKEVNYNPIFKLKLVAANSLTLLKQDKPIGLVVKRKDFDQFLVDLCIKKGVVFVDDCEYIGHTSCRNFYKIYTTKGKFSSKYLIGADGIYSKVAKNTGLRTHYIKWEMGIAASCEINDESVIEKDSNSIEFIFTNVLGGMGWVFSGKNFVNLGVGGYALDGQNVLKASRSLVRERLKGEEPSFNLRSYFLPAGGIKRKIARERIFLIGDAAGFVDAFSGEGIYYAMASGKIAAEIIINHKTARDYEKYCYGTFLSEFRLSALLSIFLGDRSRIIRFGVDEYLLDAFYRILTVPPEQNCYKKIFLGIIKRKYSSPFHYSWLRMIFS